MQLKDRKLIILDFVVPHNSLGLLNRIKCVTFKVACTYLRALIVTMIPYVGVT